MTALADMQAVIERTLSEHQEEYDSDCQIHYGCKCIESDADLPGDQYDTDRRSKWYVTHAAAAVMQALADEMGLQEEHVGLTYRFFGDESPIRPRSRLVTDWTTTEGTDHERE